jgi:hypothetical protein
MAVTRVPQYAHRNTKLEQWDDTLHASPTAVVLVA